jgi:pyridoxamine 5'-phosphate oxidase
MSLALWRSVLAKALHLNRDLVYARYVQLATVRTNGQPANRTVVFRGFLDQTNQLKFITDDRSEKIDQIAANPWGEVCWYFPKTREQFRLLGQLTVVQAEYADTVLVRARQIQWRELSDAARLQFVWPASGQPRVEARQFQPDPPDPLHPPANFCLLLLAPIQVDHLALKGDPQDRHLYHYQQDRQVWTMIAVNP